MPLLVPDVRLSKHTVEPPRETHGLRTRKQLQLLLMKILDMDQLSKFLYRSEPSHNLGLDDNGLSLFVMLKTTRSTFSICPFTSGSVS